jgi:hypothetical protein
MKRYSSCKDWNQKIQHLIKLGWSYKRRRKHGCLISPDGYRKVTIPCTPSDYRSLKNFLSLIS